MEQKRKYNWLANALRREDEAVAPPWSRRPSDELYRGGFSAEWSRRQRHAKSAHKAAHRRGH